MRSIKVFRPALYAGIILSGIAFATKVSAFEHAVKAVELDVSTVEGFVVRDRNFGPNAPTYLADIRPSGPFVTKSGVVDVDATIEHMAKATGLGPEATKGVMYGDDVSYTKLGRTAWLDGATNWRFFAGTSPICPSSDGCQNSVLRYDTPAIGAAKISVSIGNSDLWDAKRSVTGSTGYSGYVDYKDDTETVTASATFGVSVAVGWSHIVENAAYVDEY